LWRDGEKTYSVSEEPVDPDHLDQDSEVYEQGVTVYPESDWDAEAFELATSCASAPPPS
jgi:hypothetical protein